MKPLRFSIVSLVHSFSCDFQAQSICLLVSIPIGPATDMLKLDICQNKLEKVFWTINFWEIFCLSLFYPELRYVLELSKLFCLLPVQIQGIKAGCSASFRNRPGDSRTIMTRGRINRIFILTSGILIRFTAKRLFILLTVNFSDFWTLSPPTLASRCFN